MTPLELDQKFTFESFIVGPANRLASAASRRVAEQPGSAYNPLFIYSASGLGKTHLITSIGHHAKRLHPNLVVVYDTLENFMEKAMSAVESGEREGFRDRVRTIGLLMLDDVQFLAGRRSAQDELLRVLDALSSRSGQLVLASDRPPGEINDLDDRLLSRFAGGLVADISAPEYETRVAIVNRKADERGHRLSSGVAEALARVSFGNVRELQGGLNRLLAIQELDGRSVTADEIATIFGQARRSDDFGSFLNDVTGTLDAVVQNVEQERRIAAAILKYESEGYATRRLEAALTGSIPSVQEVELLLQGYEEDVGRLQLLQHELATANPNAAELSDPDLFRNPDRVADAEAALTSVRERAKPLPAPPPNRSFETLTINSDSFAVKAARAIVEKPGQEYNPLFLHGPEGSGKTTLLAALANEFIARHPGSPVAFVHGKNFAAELIQALEKNASDSWRDRYRQARLFVLDDTEALVDTERAQDELFHLFEELRRGNAQLVFGATAAPSGLTGLEDRLRTRFESGLVLQLELLRPVSAADDGAEPRNQTPAAWVATMAEQDEREPIFDDFFLSREKVIWNWPYLEDCLFEEID
ncbi:MAG TPA: DnaA/Hda family protein [Longimicrobiales bacterium]|nr:DnaA/Hda family protein [Longimicrobiales bacterium]